MNPFRSYELYTCLNLHFKGSYDAFKYNFKTRVNLQSYEKRRDKYFFAKFANKFNNENDLINFYVSNFISGVKWIGECNEERYVEWQKRNESLKYLVKQDLHTILDTCDSLQNAFKVENSQVPKIISLYQREEISVETLCLFERYLKFIEKKDSQIGDTIMWPDLKIAITKYEPFIKFDSASFNSLLRSVFQC